MIAFDKSSMVKSIKKKRRLGKGGFRDNGRKGEAWWRGSSVDKIYIYGQYGCEKKSIALSTLKSGNSMTQFLEHVKNTVQLRMQVFFILLPLSPLQK